MWDWEPFSFVFKRKTMVVSEGALRYSSCLTYGRPRTISSNHRFYNGFARWWKLVLFQSGMKRRRVRLVKRTWFVLRRVQFGNRFR